jgi:hypothetical protein
MFRTVAEPSNKAVTVAFDGFINRVTQKYRSGLTSLIVLDEPIKKVFFGIVFNEFNPFYETVNEKIIRLFEAGLTDLFLVRHLFNFEKKKRFNEEIGPQVLTMDQLEIAFIFCFAPFALCLACFIGEFAVAWITTKKRKKKKKSKRRIHKNPNRKQVKDEIELGNISERVTVEKDPSKKIESFEPQHEILISRKEICLSKNQVKSTQKSVSATVHSRGCLKPSTANVSMEIVQRPFSACAILKTTQEPSNEAQSYRQQELNVTKLD